MSFVFDQDSLARQQALDNAFDAGWKKGRAECDEHVMAECVALRVRLASRADFWACVESIGLSVLAAVTILGVWGLLAWVVFGG